jgi:TolB protein
MLVRAYRLTDKFGVVILKSSVALVDVTLEGFYIFLSRIFAPIARVLGIIFRPVVIVLNALALFLVNLFRRATGQTTISAERMMARRAARAQMEAAIVEDPLRAQNRVLSALTVILLALLIGVVLWATNPSRSVLADLPPIESIANAALLASTPAEGAAPSPGPLATPVPTVTPLPSVLEVRGSLAYTVRELGQTDIWAVPVGSRTAIRLTNSPEDERDPSWSPDGRRLAYASRQDGNWEIYIYDLVSGETTRMTYDLSFQGAPSWDPAGEWLVHETYQSGNLDIQFLRIDGSQTPVAMPGNSPAPDFSPAWSPDGRQIAFVSWRDGNQDIYIFNLDDQTVTNLTNTPTRQEDYPAWSPDSEWISYSALENGQETVFVKQANNPSSTAQPFFGGRNPSWSPDGASIVFSADLADGGQLIASPFSGAGVITQVIPVPTGTTGAVWTGAPLPQQLVNSGGLSPAVSSPLYIENVTERPIDPPYVLKGVGVSAEPASLSDRVDDSFTALREAAVEEVGWDFLGRLDDVFWALERPPEPGVERRHWLLTGRAFSVPRSSILGVPPAIEVVREDIGVDTYWRTFVRVVEDAQNGELGEPLRRMPWDFASRTEGDVEAYDQGGRLRGEIPQGYYIDLTQIAQDYGWDRAPAGFDWRANANSINYWLFRKTDGLSWFDAMREIYPEGMLINFAPTGTAIPGLENIGSATPPTAPPPIEVEATPAGGVEGAVPTLPPQVEELLTPEGDQGGG